MSTQASEAVADERIAAWLADPQRAAFVPVWNEEAGEYMWVTRAEAAAGMVRYARSLGAGTAACGEAERQALAMLRGEAQ